MKTFISTSICLIILLNSYVYSQDSTIKNYLPLQVGNVWVYYYNGSTLPSSNHSGYHRVEITGTTTIDSKLFYTYTYAQKIITGDNSATGDFYFYNLKPIRIDSTGNIYQWQACSSGLNRRDSLSVPLQGSYIDCKASYYQYFKLTNENFITVFDTISRRLKIFQTNNGQPVFNRQFIKGIGIYNLYEGWTYHYIGRILRGCVIDGVVYGDTTFPIYTGVKLISENTPSKYSLSQNYPNPFNPITNVKFSIVNSGDVKLVVYDVQGREVQTLVNERLQPGTYEAAFDASTLNTGVYFYKLITNTFSETKKMLLIK